MNYFHPYTARVARRVHTDRSKRAEHAKHAGRAGRVIHAIHAIPTFDVVDFVDATDAVDALRHGQCEALLHTTFSRSDAQSLPPSGAFLLCATGCVASVLLHYWAPVVQRFMTATLPHSSGLALYECCTCTHLISSNLFQI